MKQAHEGASVDTERPEIVYDDAQASNLDRPLNLASLRQRLQSQPGPAFWRSLDELADTEEFRQFLYSEFPREAATVDLSDPVSRRRFLKLMGASLALAGASACTRQPTERIFPYAQMPEEIIPGKPLYYATAILQGGVATGVLVESHMGRPTKIEGNPQHPGSLGATDAFTQASVLTLYDPDRSTVVTNVGNINSWAEFVNALSQELTKQTATRGAGLRILTETITSPTLADLLQSVLVKYPAARWHQYEPVGRDNSKEGAKLAFGQVVETIYRLDQAQVIVSLDADFLSDWPGSVRYARDFADARRVADQRPSMNRLYVLEASLSLAGGMADHRLPLPVSEIEGVARALAAQLGIISAGVPDLPMRHRQWVNAMAQDLTAHRGASVVIAGESQPPWVHALVHAMNDALGNVGKTVVYTDSIEANPVNHLESLRELVTDMDAGRVQVLVILGGNPVLTAPADFQFGERMKKVGFRVHLGYYDDETSELCHWHVPQTHELESWGDARAYDGTVSFIQPLIAPLYQGRSPIEFVAALLGQLNPTSYDLVRAYWRRQNPAADFERWWQTALHDGVVAGSARPAKTVTLDVNKIKSQVGSPPTPSLQSDASSLEVVFRPDPTIWDGRFANNAWLQELPKPATKLTWDNAVLVSPNTAERLGLSNEDVVELRFKGHSVRGPVWLTPGLPDRSVTVHLGYGRTRAGRVGTGLGFNAYQLRRSDAYWAGSGLELIKLEQRYQLASTQHHHSMQGRHPVRVGTLDQYRNTPDFVKEMGHEPPRDLTLYPEYQYEGNAWGLAVDLNVCTGCNACVIACQSENNIAVVGKEQVIVGREMHWIRIDRYYEGDWSNPKIYNQPVMCMQCENAPCEVVCPVHATNHSREGLNQMVYNRCVGTRYCANNCPYKVRRFNFMLYSDWETPILKLQRNPDVTVRSRGVMEKCSYCVQRITAARIEAKKQDRPIRDGEIMTACQQVCPTQAIVFGDINDPDSRVSKQRAESRHYSLLAELNTRPRTTYLARLRNPNPQLEEGELQG